MRCSAKTSMLFSDRCVRVPPLDLKCCLDASETAETENLDGFLGDLVVGLLEAVGLEISVRYISGAVQVSGSSPTSNVK